MLVSIIIPNYNYAEFIAAAIDSALAVQWSPLEVIVVDDGSTDESRSVIERYGDRVIAIFQPNGGQKTACNAGFARSRGEVVLFLDSDDTLDPRIIKELAAVWQPGVSKVQFQMQVLDAQGRSTGAVLPQYGIVPTPDRIRAWVRRAGAYPTPPGSGNAYSRRFLERIFPLEGPDRFSDSYCVSAAPYFGDVLTIAKPLVGYRVHGKNDGAMSTLDAKRFSAEVTRALWRFTYAQGIARSLDLDAPTGVFPRSMTILAYRLASLRLSPSTHPIAGDSVSEVLRAIATAFFVPQGLPILARSALLVWSAMVALAPRPWAERLVLWRFSSSARPAPLRRALQAVGVLKSAASGPSERPTSSRFALVQNGPARRLLSTARDMAGRWNARRVLDVPQTASSSEKPKVLILGVYLADRAHAANHLVERFQESTACAPTQLWIALNGEPDSPALARVTVERVEGKVPKFVLMNRLLSRVDWRAYDYVMVADDDITVPRNFLDGFIGYQAKHDFALAQPARTLWSRSSYAFVRQRVTTEARRTRFVEIGPIFCMRRDLAQILLPFDEASPMGWGYDLVWPVQAEQAGLKMGIVDATPVDHCMRGQAAAYSGSIESKVRDAYLKTRAHLELPQALVVLEGYKGRRPRWA